MKKVIRFCLTVLTLAGAVRVSAVMRLDKYVAISKALPNGDNLPLAIAFQDNKSCLIWYFLPRTYVTNSISISDVRESISKIDNQNLIGMVYSLSVGGDPTMKSDDIESLRLAVYNNLKSRGDSDSCKGSVDNKSVSSVFLTSALASVVPYNDPSLAETPRFLSQTNEPISSGNTSMFNSFTSLGFAWSHSHLKYDLFGRQQFELLLDASNSKLLTSLKLLESKSRTAGNQKNYFSLGQVAAVVDGVIGEIHSTLEFKGTMSQEFQSQIENTGCSTNHKDQNAAFWGMAAAGAGVGGISFSENTQTCTYELRTVPKGDGVAQSAIVIDHTGTPLSFTDANNKAKPIAYSFCNEKSCTNTTLEAYLNMQLLHEFLMTNFDVTFTKLSDNTFKAELGKRGLSQTKFEFKAEYLRRFDGSYALPLTLLTDNLHDLADEASLFISDDPVIACAVKERRSQLSLFANIFLRGISLPVPVSAACMGAIH